jgi:lipoate-protein ligase A
VRRPTGGGLVPHDADWTYSLVVPPAHPWYTLRAPDSYERVHAWIRDAFALLGVPTELAAAGRTPQPGQCFVGHERSDVLWHGRKLAGAAQRRNQSGLLIQGSVQPPPLAPPLRRPDWEQSMAEAARCAWGVQWQAWPPHPEILTRARGLAREKYSQATHNEKR